MIEIALYVYLFYIGFAVSVSVYRQWLKGVLNPLNKLLFAPVLIGFFALDIALNYTLFMVLGHSPKGTHTISDRMAFYRKQGTKMQRFVADLMCDKLLNPIDPAGTHC